MKIQKIALMMFALSPFQAIAVPEILSLDKTDFASGQMSIAGSAFGAGATVLLYDQFESEPEALDGDEIPLTSPVVGEWTANSYDKPLLYHPDAHSGNFSGQIFYRGADDSSGHFKQLRLQFPAPITEIFFSYWVKMPEGAYMPGATEPGVFPDGSHWKFTWLYDRDRSANSSDLCLPTYVSDSTFYLAGNDYNLATDISNSWWSFDEWMRIAVWLRPDSADPTADGDVMYQTVSVDKGVYEYRVNTPVFDDDYANGPGETYEGDPDIKQFQWIEFPGWVRETSHQNATPVYDDIYIAIGENSVARVEVADDPVYTRATKVATQTVTTWGDSAIAIELNKAGFTDEEFEDAYLFVWDKDGTRNTAGFPITADPNPPVDITLTPGTL